MTGEVAGSPAEAAIQRATAGRKKNFLTDNSRASCVSKGVTIYRVACKPVVSSPIMLIASGRHLLWIQGHRTVLYKKSQWFESARTEAPTRPSGAFPAAAVVMQAQREVGSSEDPKWGVSEVLGVTALWVHRAPPRTSHAYAAPF